MRHFRLHETDISVLKILGSEIYLADLLLAVNLPIGIPACLTLIFLCLRFLSFVPIGYFASFQETFDCHLLF